MFIRLFSNIYFKLSSFKQNIKTLPGDLNTFNENWTATIRLEIAEVELFLNNIGALIQDGFEATEIIAVASKVKELRKRDEQEMHFHIFHNGELTGLTIIVYRLPSSLIGLEFITDKELAEQIQEAVELYENAPGKMWH
ncbi:hypothetical protein [Paenibacillus alba]|uniref:Uncharacterized protein n=1 Tax=Paenibacillus alba TaxID=1197127 RepID=A0ABU6G541_9BACL|nr:hypothetical protein [Paenibacillus alba]MEC0229295.1 hypothetical protein [Paenibacillus alba]